jgi:ubiquinone/menaquinone biosynthesis C-methylase UbiE
LTSDKEKPKLFDSWPEDYDRWFTTPIGALIRKIESELLQEFLHPQPGERILDAGCGTGVFTLDFLSKGAHVVGIDLSLPMLQRAKDKAGDSPLLLASADLLRLPFRKDAFDKLVSVTALEFIENGKMAIEEFFRVVRRGGSIVVATLNSLSPWAARRKSKKDHPLFKEAIFRSPEELLSLAPTSGIVRTAVHFEKGDDLEKALEIERNGKEKNLDTGAFVVARWVKP